MKNIIKRIIVGVCVVLIVGFVRSCEVKALVTGSYQFPNAYYEIPYNYDTLNIPISNAFTSYGAGEITFSLAYFTTNNEIRSVALSINNGGGLYNCELIGLNANDSLKNSEYGNYLFYSAKCKLNIWSNYAINNIQIKFRNPWGSYETNRMYMSNVMTFYGNDNQDIVNAVNNANIKSQILTIIQQLTTIDNRIATNHNELIQYFNSKLDSINSTLNSTNSKIDETNDKLQETNDFLTDSSLPTNASGDIGDLNSNIATNGTISSLVSMPITFLQKIINGLNGACSPIVIGELYEYNMTMPCINPQQYIGIIWNIIDVICAGFLSFHFGKKLVSIFHKITSMKDGGLEQAYD